MLLLTLPVLLTPLTTFGQDVKVVKTYPDGGGYDLSIGGKLYTTLDEAQAKGVEHDRGHLADDEKIIAAQAGEIVQLRKALDAAHQIEALDNRMNDLHTDMLNLRLAELSKFEQVNNDLAALSSNSKKSFLDKLPVRLVIAGIGVGANLYSFTNHPYAPPKGTPCNP